MFYDEEKVYSIIKNAYLKNGQDVSQGYIITQCRKDGMDWKKIGHILRNLHMKHMKIKPSEIFGSWTPIISEDEKDSLMEVNDTSNANVTDDRIRLCIDEFSNKNGMFPKPLDIEITFKQLFGKPSVKDFTRLIRKMYEEKKLDRTDDFRYYYKNAKVNGNINNFIDPI